MTIRKYSELIRIPSIVGRFEYLALNGIVGERTFGWERMFNQEFYRSYEWKLAREAAIVRDLGRDLGVEGFEIGDRMYVHHMTPLTMEQLDRGDPMLFDLDNLITTQHRTHNAIHYGDVSLLPRVPVERRPGDTKLW